MDARYQRASEPVSELSLDPYAGLFTWDEVYAGWTSTALQYYWRRLPITIGEFDKRYYDRRDVIAFEMASAGIARPGPPSCASSSATPTPRSGSEPLRCFPHSMPGSGPG